LQCAPAGKHPHQEFIQVNTTNILFICGGAFVGLDKIIERRIGKRVIGFGSDEVGPVAIDEEYILNRVETEDLIKYGMIPEFVGRFSSIAALEELDREALKTILTEPKNAVCKQYEKLFELEGVELEITDDALDAIAQKAMERKTGARGLRAILEKAMMDIMFDIPSISGVTKCIITKEVITEGSEPLLVYQDQDQVESA